MAGYRLMKGVTKIITTSPYCSLPGGWSAISFVSFDQQVVLVQKYLSTRNVLSLGRHTILLCHCSPQKGSQQQILSRLKQLKCPILQVSRPNIHILILTLFL